MSTNPAAEPAGTPAAVTARGAEHLYWALLLIWAALVVGADGLGLLPAIGVADTWNWIFLGAGTLATIGCVRRLLSHPRQDPDLSDYAVAGILLVLGLGGFVSAWLVTSVVLLVLGLIVLVTDARRAGPAAG
jgi:hypothetical protein